MEHTQVLFALFIVFVAAQIGAEIAQRLGLPAVVGEIMAGCAIGPSALRLVSVAPLLQGQTNTAREPLLALAEVGAVLLLFAVGLETRLESLKRVGPLALRVGVSGMIPPFIFGFIWARFLGYSVPNALFIGAAFVATSAGITARVLGELGMMGRIEARVTMGAAIIDDILSMLLLAIVSSVAKEGGVEIGPLALSLAQAVGFIALVSLAGTRVLRRSSEALEAPINPLSPLTFSLAACLGLAAAGAWLGLAPIIGAFLAGMIFAETAQRRQLERQIQVIMAFMTPFFFVVTGMQMSLGQLASLSAVFSLLLITTLAVLGKLAGATFAARSLGRKSALVVGLGMVPRGEVVIVVASVGRSANLFSEQVYALIIAMSLLTSIIAPPLLKRQLAGLPKEAPLPGEESELYAVNEAGFEGRQVKPPG